MDFLLELTGEVGSDSFSAAKVRRVLKGASDRHVDIMIDSCGGYLSEGLSISGAFRDHGDVTAHLRGLVASAATVASLGAARVSMAPDALFLVHKVSLTFLDWAQRNADQLEAFISELQSTKENLDAMDKAIAVSYARRCRKPVADLLDLMKNERWLSASEALDWGFVDEIQNDSKSVAEPEDKKNCGGGKDSKHRNAISISKAQADYLRSCGLPIPAQAVIAPDSFFSSAKNLFQSFVSPIVDAINSLKNQDMQENQSSQQQNGVTSQPTDNAALPVNAAEPAQPAVQPAPVQNSQPAQQPQDSVSNADLQAQIAELRAQLAARPGDVSNAVTAQPVKPQNNRPQSPFEDYVRTSHSAQALYDSIP